MSLDSNKKELVNKICDKFYTQATNVSTISALVDLLSDNDVVPIDEINSLAKYVNDLVNKGYAVVTNCSKGEVLNSKLINNEILIVIPEDYTKQVNDKFILNIFICLNVLSNVADNFNDFRSEFVKSYTKGFDGKSRLARACAYCAELAKNLAEQDNNISNDFDEIIKKAINRFPNGLSDLDNKYKYLRVAAIKQEIFAENIKTLESLKSLRENK